MLYSQYAVLLVFTYTDSVIYIQVYNIHTSLMISHAVCQISVLTQQVHTTQNGSYMLLLHMPHLRTIISYTVNMSIRVEYEKFAC